MLCSDILKGEQSVLCSDMLMGEQSVLCSDMLKGEQSVLCSDMLKGNSQCCQNQGRQIKGFIAEPLISRNLLFIFDVFLTIVLVF